MVIVGKKYLDANFYNSITIYGDKIIIYSRNRIVNLDTSYKFSDECKGKSNEEIIQIVIEHYLRNTKLARILNNEVYGVSGRKLKINVNISNELKRKIINKYENDRINHFYETEEKSYRVISVESLSEYSGNRYILATKGNGIANMELSFLSEMVENTFQDEIICMNQEGLYVKLSSKTKYINIGNQLINLCGNKICEIVMNHNSIIENNKAMQLKLEV